MEEDIFRKLLEERGWHLTKQRHAILQKAFSYKGHFDPESLYLAMREKGSDVEPSYVVQILLLHYLLVSDGIALRGRNVETAHRRCGWGRRASR